MFGKVGTGVTALDELTDQPSAYAFMARESSYLNFDLHRYHCPLPAVETPY
jgi:hypothetical protein